MLFELSNLNSNLALTLGYLNPALNNSVKVYKYLLFIIPRVNVGFEVEDSQQGAQRQIGYKHLISNKHKLDNCFDKNTHKILRILLDFICKKKKDFRLVEDVDATVDSEFRMGKRKVMKEDSVIKLKVLAML